MFFPELSKERREEEKKNEYLANLRDVNFKFTQKITSFDQIIFRHEKAMFEYYDSLENPVYNPDIAKNHGGELYHYYEQLNYPDKIGAPKMTWWGKMYQKMVTPHWENYNDRDMFNRRIKRLMNGIPFQKPCENFKIPEHLEKYCFCESELKDWKNGGRLVSFENMGLVGRKGDRK